MIIYNQSEPLPSDTEFPAETSEEEELDIDETEEDEV